MLNVDVSSWAKNFRSIE